jgi:hypothetical protein
MSPYFVPVNVPAPIAGAGLPGLIWRAVAFSAGGDGGRKALKLSTLQQRQQEKSPGSEAGARLGFDGSNLMVARSLHNSAISENQCIFLDNDQHFLDNQRSVR